MFRRGGGRGAAVRGARGLAAAGGGRRAIPAHAGQLPARHRRGPHQGASAGTLHIRRRPSDPSKTASSSFSLSSATHVLKIQNPKKKYRLFVADNW